MHNQQDPRNSMSGWYFSSTDLQASLAGERMLNPSMDLSNPCNLNCPYCYIEEKNSSRKLRKPQELAREELLDVVDDFAAAGAKTVNLVGAGEPTIDPLFREIVQRVHSLGLTTVLFTNGIRLAHDPCLVDWLYERNVTVVLKFNSADANTQDLVAGRPGYAQKRDAALERLLDYGFNAFQPTRLALDIIAFRGNLKELPSIHRFCRLNGIFPIIGDFIPTGRTEEGHFVGFESVRFFSSEDRVRIQALLEPLSNSERSALVDQLSEIDRHDFNIYRPPACAYYGGGVCTQLLGVYVDIEGRIWPCVARNQETNGGNKSLPLGALRNGDRPSSLWKTHPYLQHIRNAYKGNCPYKPELVGNLAQASVLFSESGARKGPAL